MQSTSLSLATTRAQLKSGANWFYWIAGLSVINSLISVFGGTWNFVIGLGLTQFIDAFAQVFASRATGQLPILLPILGLGIDLIVVCFFALFGFLANQTYRWAFLLGMLLYTLDGGIDILLGSWLSVAFHAYVLFNLFGGLRAAHRLRSYVPSNAGTPSASSPLPAPQMANPQMSIPRWNWRPILLITGVAFLPIVILVGALLYYGV